MTGLVRFPELPGDWVLRMILWAQERGDSPWVVPVWGLPEVGKVCVVSQKCYNLIREVIGVEA